MVANLILGTHMPDLQLLLKATARYFAPETVSYALLLWDEWPDSVALIGNIPSSKNCHSDADHCRHIRSGKLSHDHTEGVVGRKCSCQNAMLLQKMPLTKSIAGSC
jgi:hypothetical protein